MCVYVHVCMRVCACACTYVLMCMCVNCLLHTQDESLNVGFNISQKLPVVFRAEIPHYVISREEETDKTIVLYCVKVTCQHMGAHHEEWVVERQFTDFKHL